MLCISLYFSQTILNKVSVAVSRRLSNKNECFGDKIRGKFQDLDGLGLVVQRNLGKNVQIFNLCIVCWCVFDCEQKSCNDHRLIKNKHKFK